MSARELTVCQVLVSLVLGGAEVLAARLARRLSDEFRVVFACLDELGQIGEQLRADGFGVHVLGRRPGVDWRCSRRLGTLFRRERVDVVHAHQYGPFFYSATARLAAPRPPIVLTEHGQHFPDLPSRSHAITNRLLLRRGDRVVGVGRDVRRALVENEGFPADRVEVIHNGVNLAAFEGGQGDREAIRREIGVGPSDFVIAQAARLSPIKDHATAIRALAQLAGRREDFRLVVIGDGPEAGPIRELVRSLGLERYVRMLGQRSDVPRLLGAADLGLLTSLSEGIPLSLIEAMAAGLPVVATRVGGVSEVVEEGRTGELATAGDSDGLAGHILRLADDRALRRGMGLAGRERVHACFSEDRMVEEYNLIYRELAGFGRRPVAIRDLSE